MSQAPDMLRQIRHTLGSDPTAAATFTGEGALASAFPVTEFAAACIAAAGLEIAELVADRVRPVIDRRLASFWFGGSLFPVAWSVPPGWDPIAGDYQTRDGWIRLHTNAPHHRRVALQVLDVENDRDAVAAAVRNWSADELESAVVAQGGCAAAMRTREDWAQHPQGIALQSQPLIAWREGAGAVPDASWRPRPERPLDGLRVLDLTRVLAGPVATRFLAGYGADVLRIDPPSWDEPGVVPEVTLGKRAARLDLKSEAGMRRLEDLLADADILVHGYRSDALERMGLGEERRRAIRPSLVDVALDAYGWTGPWRARRGFDSLVQMSCGIAGEGMAWAASDRPTPLPVQALDHGTGYLMAAAAVRGIRRRLETGKGSTARLSLARTSALLMAGHAEPRAALGEPDEAADCSDALEQTSWGPAKRLRPPLVVASAPMHWDRPASALGTHDPSW